MEINRFTCLKVHSAKAQTKTLDMLSLRAHLFKKSDTTLKMVTTNSKTFFLESPITEETCKTIRSKKICSSCRKLIFKIWNLRLFRLLVSVFYLNWKHQFKWKTLTKSWKKRGKFRDFKFWKSVFDMKKKYFFIRVCFIGFFGGKIC